ncbi:MAG: hypothetical protein ABIJ84_03755 [bacterium]
MNPHWKATMCNAIVLPVVVLLMTIMNLLLFVKIQNQKRQIDQLCQVTFALARLQGAEDQNGFEGGKEYCFFFGDYNKGMALVGKFDDGLSYRKKPRIIIMSSLDAKLLNEWSKQPLLYGRYRKIR